MTNIDCGGAGYKTPKEIELEKENKRLHEQLHEANRIIKYYNARELDYTTDDGEIEKCGPAFRYLEKWGVKWAKH